MPGDISFDRTPSKDCRPLRSRGRASVQKEDDRPESIEIRLKVYGQTTAPLIAFYQNLGLLVEVAAIRDIPTRFARERFWS
jgi:adenylate kinase family enzyme